MTATRFELIVELKMRVETAERIIVALRILFPYAIFRWEQHSGLRTRILGRLCSGGHATKAELSYWNCAAMSAYCVARLPGSKKTDQGKEV